MRVAIIIVHVVTIVKRAVAAVPKMKKKKKRKTNRIKKKKTRVTTFPGPRASVHVCFTSAAPSSSSAIIILYARIIFRGRFVGRKTTTDARLNVKRRAGVGGR